MPTSKEFIPLAEYVRRLKPLLPEEAFDACPSKLLVPFIHFLLLTGAYLVIRLNDHWSVWLLCSFLIGHFLPASAFSHTN